MRKEYLIRQGKDFQENERKKRRNAVIDSIVYIVFQFIPILLLAVIYLSTNFDLNKYDLFGNIFLVEVVSAAVSLYNNNIAKRNENREKDELFKMVTFATIISLCLSLVLYCVQFMASKDSDSSLIIPNDGIFIGFAITVLVLEVCIILYDNYRGLV